MEKVLIDGGTGGDGRRIALYHIRFGENRRLNPRLGLTSFLYR